MLKYTIAAAWCLLFLTTCVVESTCSLHKKRITQYDRKYQRNLKFRNVEKIKSENFQQDKYFSQILDHFNSNDNTTWMQVRFLLFEFKNDYLNFFIKIKRYFVNEQFFTPNGPIFLYIEGEWEAQYNNIKYGALVEYAKRFSALIVSLEHRFYGTSIPTELARLNVFIEF
jgi:hypothetical protein